MNTPKPSKSAVFLAITFKTATCMEYPNNAELAKIHHHIMMGMRSDGSFGFVGGMVEAGESELQALERECLEEANINISELRNLTRLGHHDMPGDDFRVILYHAKVSKEQALDIMKNASAAKHALSETAGVNSIIIMNKSAFPKNSFMPLIGKEFKLIAQHIGSDILMAWGNEIEDNFLWKR